MHKYSCGGAYDDDDEFDENLLFLCCYCCHCRFALIGNNGKYQMMKMLMMTTKSEVLFVVVLKLSMRNWMNDELLIEWSFFQSIVVAAELLPIAGLQAMVIMAGCRLRLMMMIIVRIFLFCYLLIRHFTVSLSKLLVVADIASYRKRLESDEKKKKKKKKRSTINLLDVRFV